MSSWVKFTHKFRQQCRRGERRTFFRNGKYYFKNYRTAVPTRHVYPLFIELAGLWTFFQEEIVLLSVFQNIRTNLKEFIKQHDALFPHVYLEKATANLKVTTMQQYIAEAAENGARISEETGKGSQDGKDINWIYQDSLSHNMKFEQLTFRFRSFCPFQLAEHGLLIPGCAKIGILCFDEGFYVFRKGYDTSRVFNLCTKYEIWAISYGSILQE